MKKLLLATLMSTLALGAMAQPPSKSGNRALCDQCGTVQVVNLSGDPAAAGEAIDIAEQATGMDLDADGKIGSGAAPPGSATADPPAGDDDRIAQLERLAKLRDTGALTQAEFETEKARLLGGG